MRLENDLNSVEVPLRSLLGDGGFAWSAFPDLEERVQRTIRQLAKDGVYLLCKEFPRTAEDFKKFLLTKFPEASFLPLPPQIVEATREATIVAGWLKPQKGEPPPLRKGRPIINAARAIAPHLLYH